MVMIRDILMYMDRTFVKQTKKDPVYHMGLKCFLNNVGRHREVRDRLQKILLTNIAKERDGEQIDFVLLKNILYMLVTLGITSKKIYQHDFEREY